MSNYAKELKQTNKYHEGWFLSKKYTTILMDHENHNEYFELAPNIYHQFISELKLKNIPVFYCLVFDFHNIPQHNHLLVRDQP